MNRSRIIRSIIVALFMICCLAMLFVCVKNSLEIQSTFKTLYKFIYVIVILVSIIQDSKLRKSLMKNFENTLVGIIYKKY